MGGIRLSLILLVALLSSLARAEPSCTVGDLKACPEGQYCAAEWEEGTCPERGVCRPFLPHPEALELSLPIPAGERIYCAKGSLRPGRSTHSACDPATRFAIDLSGTAAQRPHFVVAPADGVAYVRDGCATRDLNRQEAPDPCNHGFGNLVRIDHGANVYSQLAHLSSVLVRDGARVRRGDILGIEGNTGNAGAKHIHFSLHVGSARARRPGPTIPLSRIRVREGNRVRVRSWRDLHCGDFENNPIPDPASLIESDNVLGAAPPARFGFLAWMDEVAQLATHPDPAERRRGIEILRRKYDQPTSPYWIGVAYLMNGDLRTAEEELTRALRRSDRGEGPPWLRPWVLLLLGEVAFLQRRHADARSLFEDALGTPGDDSTGFRARARAGLRRINAAR